MNKNRTAKVNIEQIGIDEDVLFNLMTHDANYDFYALRPDEVIELQNSIKAIIDDRDRLKQANADLLAALEFMISNCPECDGDGVIYDDDYWTVGPTGGPCPICQGARSAIAAASEAN